MRNRIQLWFYLPTLAALAWIGSFAVPLSAQNYVDLKNGAVDAFTLVSESLGAELRSKADTLRKRMLNWKEFDFRTLFGAPVLRADGVAKSLYPGDAFGRLSTEPVAAGLPGAPFGQSRVHGDIDRRMFNVVVQGMDLTQTPQGAASSTCIISISK